MEPHRLECQCQQCTERICRTMRFPAISPYASTELLIRELRSRALDQYQRDALAALLKE